jgi:hypothetical protein
MTDYEWLVEELKGYESHGPDELGGLFVRVGKVVWTFDCDGDYVRTEGL